jgi:hypothetical protein
MEIGKQEPTLAQAALALREEVRELRLAVSQLKPRVERAEKVSVRAAGIATVIVVLTVIIGFVGYRQILAEAQIDNTNTRIDGLCPVLALVIGSADPESREPGPARDGYVRALEVMRQSYSDLACTTPFIPPRAD